MGVVGTENGFVYLMVKFQIKVTNAQFHRKQRGAWEVTGSSANVGHQTVSTSHVCPTYVGVKPRVIWYKKIKYNTLALTPDDTPAKSHPHVYLPTVFLTLTPTLTPTLSYPPTATQH